MKKTRIIYLILTIACISFIWINSFLDAEESSKLSNGILIFINNILLSFGIKESFSEFIIRKMAHFSEFAVLAFLLTKNFKFANVNMKLVGYGVPFIGLLVALVDETIQMFSFGRTSSVIDVWIDFCGVCVGFGITMLTGNLLKN